MTWARSLGDIVAFGLEGTGSYGSELCRFLRSKGHSVVEINRPDRAARRSRGKSDSVDAQAAAFSVLSGKATSVPKSNDDQVEMIRLLNVTRQGAIKARTQAMNTLKAAIVGAPSILRDSLSELTDTKLIQTCSQLRPGDLTDVHSVLKATLRSLARRWQNLDKEIKEVTLERDAIVASRAPSLLALKGVGSDCAAALLVAAGDNPERVTSEAKFAALCGVAPVEPSSGKTTRHRLNRGGNRKANSGSSRVSVGSLTR